MTPDEILSGPDYMVCHKYGDARIPRATCVARQKHNDARLYGYKYPGCQDCAQGQYEALRAADPTLAAARAVRKLKRASTHMPITGVPVPIVAPIKTGCRIESGMTKKEKSMKTPKPEKPKCRIAACQERAEHRGLCENHYDHWRRGTPSVVAEIGSFTRVHEFRKRRPPLAKRTPGSDTRRNLAPFVEATGGSPGDLPVTLDFSRYPDLLRAPRERPDHQVRTLDGQIIWELLQAAARVESCEKS